MIEISPEEIARKQKFIEADELYLSGDVVAAEQIYREAKEPFELEIESEAEAIPKPIEAPQQLSPAGAVYWRLYQEGLETGFESKILAPLKLLVERNPEFIPGHLHYAKALKDYGRDEEALEVLEAAVNLYPNQPTLLRAKIEEDKAQEKYLEASLTARQFALFNPEHPQAEEFTQLADENLGKLSKKIAFKIDRKGDR